MTVYAKGLRVDIYCESNLSISLRRIYKDHASMLILLAGAGSLYVCNIVLASIMAPDDYGKYGLLVAYVSIVALFSGFGFDQVIIRYSRIEEGALYIQNGSQRFASPLVISSSVVITAVFCIFFPAKYMGYIFGISFFAGISTYYYTVFRLSSRFSTAQIQRNLWKLAFPILIGGLFLSGNVGFQGIVQGIFLFFFLTVIIGWVRIKRISVCRHGSYSMDWRLLWGYFVSMLIMSFMTSADRFFIDSELSAIDVAKYFFLQNLFLFPLTQLQNYFGFKDVVRLKAGVNISIMHRLITRNCVVSFFVGVLLLLVVCGASFFFDFGGYFNVRDDYLCVAILIFTGIARVGYASLSAVMSVYANARDIDVSNLLTVLFVAFSFFIAMLLGVSGLEGVAGVFLLFWIFRALIFYFILRRGIRAI